MKVIIIRRCRGGATAAARIRRLDEHAEITVYGKIRIHIYANCGLPILYWRRDYRSEELTLQTPESFKRFRINMRIHHMKLSQYIQKVKLFLMKER